MLLVMRIYCEDQLIDDLVGDRLNYILPHVPPVIQDVHKCKQDITNKKLFHQPTEKIGPVLKPLQSLFNKMFISRGQTS
eukprot:12015579-Ditylum_brightwellii.AAC.1